MAQKKRRRRRRSAALYIPVAVLLVVFIAIFGISAFFKINEITVVGNVRYSGEEIIAVAGVSEGDNLIFFDRGNVALRICAEMPYIAKVRLNRKPPDRLVIEITESIPVAYVEAEGKYLVIDKDTRILEETTATGASGYMKVIGITAVDGKVGGDIKVEDTESARLAALKSVLSAMVEEEVYQDSALLDVSNINSITFLYQGRLNVEMGTEEKAVYKLQKMVKAAEEKLAPTAKGKLILSVDEETRFIPS